MIRVATIGLGAATRNIHLPAYSYLNGIAEKQSMGNLKEKTWDEILNSQRAEEVRGMVKNCNKNCWMIGSAAPVIWHHPTRPIYWVLKNKLLLSKRKK